MMFAGIKEQWVNALRSEEFEQGQGYLKDEDGNYCCYGVLCELAIRSGVGLRVETDWSGCTQYDGITTVLPSQVREWAGLDSDNPTSDIPLAEVVEDASLRYEDPNKPAVLAVLNDNGFTFKQIADVIERVL